MQGTPYYLLTSQLINRRLSEEGYEIIPNDTSFSVMSAFASEYVCFCLCVFQGRTGERGPDGVPGPPGPEVKRKS